MDKIKIICVVGPTASGKTALGVEIAKAVNGEIISADSMQVYKNIPIATAVASADEQQGIPHHLTEFLELSESFSVADFVQLARLKIQEIHSRGKAAVIVGGTGLFIDSLVQNINFSDVAADEKLRSELAQKSNEELYSELCRLDGNAAADIHPNNRKRVIRALELCLKGTSKTEQNEHSLLEESPYDALYIGINFENRQKLYDRINQRVDRMVEKGLVDEARQELSNAGLTSKQAIGHKELKPYFDGSISLDTAINNLKIQTRRYAKRQLTWFRRNEKIIWLYGDKLTKEQMIAEAVRLAKSHLGM